MKNDMDLPQEKKKILFTVWYANGFHGAVIHISEIAEYFISQGWEAYCVCAIMSKETKDYFLSKGIKLSLANHTNYSIEYDIIWNIHFPLFPFLLKNNIKYKKVIFNSLSSFLEIESPPLFHEAFPLILAVSEEAKDRIVNYYNVPAEKVKILKNVIPLSYFSEQKSCSESVKKVLIVSNHVPQELLDSVALFNERGIECDIIGKGHNYVAISPQILIQYDVIITIGKTVQYSLALGIPCYNYDHFGGSGYITEDNLKTEEYYNFSGRSHETKKTSVEIVSEIIDGYGTSIKNSENLKEIAKKQYSISSQIDSILDYVMSLPDMKIDLNKYSIAIDQYSFLVDSVIRFHSKLKRAKRIIRANCIEQTNRNQETAQLVGQALPDNENNKKEKN